MAKAKSKAKQKDSENVVNEIAENLEQAFLAGLGALSNAQKKGAEAFDSLVKQGEDFRKDTTKRTESLIDEVQDAIREMADDAQTRAEGLLDQVRDRSKLDKLQNVFDTRVSSAMDRLHVPSKGDLDKIDKKLNKILKLLEEKPEAPKPAAKPAAKKAPARKTSTKKASVKKTSTKKPTAKKADAPKAA